MGRCAALEHCIVGAGDAGVAREDAYRLVQRNAMRVWDGGGQFLDVLKADPDVTGALGEAELAALFDLAYHTKHVDTIFQRVFGAS